MSNFEKVLEIMTKIRQADTDDEFADSIREFMDNADEDIAEHFYSGLAKIYLSQHQEVQGKYIRMVSTMHPEGLILLVNKSEVCHAAMCGTLARVLMMAHTEADAPVEVMHNDVRRWVNNCVKDFEISLANTIALHSKQLGIEDPLDPNAKLREEALKEIN